MTRKISIRHYAVILNGKTCNGKKPWEIPDLINDQIPGIVYSADNNDSLVEARCSLWKYKDRCLEMGANAKEYAESEYCYAHFFDSLMSVYSGVVL